MKATLFWKYTRGAVILQLVLCIVVWITTLLLSHWTQTDQPLITMFYFYYPTICLIDMIPHSPGFGGEVVFGMLLGMLVYGVLFGAVFTYVKSRPSI
jgi:hypothetical protein